MEDRLYIDQVLEGQTASYAVLVDRYKDFVFTIVNRVLNNAMDSEEVAQDVFLKAFKQLNTFDGGSKFSTWLYTIAYRSAISKLRKKQVETVELDVDRTSHQPIHSITPESQMTESETSSYVRSAIDQLPVIDSVIVTLYYMDGASVSEVAEVTMLTASNVKVRLMRARKKLQESLAGMLNEEIEAIRA